ncbi:putative membrane protein [Golovinomyces cichoracearum]|uniref:Putative membrane protein n=1 Tax=Golovinomyces cichoracearum TaxID=62708 RepID=A0A420HJQ3_9PEZI|nr:putative membrane protein [Golovinomyces cichoracearum]
MPNNSDATNNNVHSCGARSRASIIRKDGYELPPEIDVKRVSILVEEFDRKEARSRESILEGQQRKRSEFSSRSLELNRINETVEEPLTHARHEDHYPPMNDARNPSIACSDTISDIPQQRIDASDSKHLNPSLKSSSRTNDTIAVLNDSVESTAPATTKSPPKANNNNKKNLLNTYNESKNTKGSGISGWSHHTPEQTNIEENDNEGEWQVMPSYAPYDIYDDDDKLIAMEKEISDDEDDDVLCGAGRGYTRVQLDEDVQSATSLDENTQYLFNDANGTGAGELEDEEQRDAVSQLQATKDLLTEGQRIAYVGMTKLILSSMIRQSESIASVGGVKKETTTAAEAIKMWGQKMMLRLYAHMEISSAEQLMIEQLSEHGVVPSDLTPTLMQNSRVKNPMAKADQSASELTDEQSPMRPRKSMSPSIIPSNPSSPLTEQKDLASTPPYQEHEGDDLPEVRTPSQLPKTANLDIDLRWTVLCDLFLTLIADSIYDSRSRTLLEKVGQNVGVDWLEICRFEKRVTDALEMQQEAEKEIWNEDKHKETRKNMALKKRYVMMGLATVGGSLVIGLSAGLLAPVIGAGLAAGLTTIGVTGTGGFLAGAGGAAIITSGAAASGGIIAVRAADRRTGAVKTFEYRPLHNNRRVNLIITVSGWMTGKVDDVRLPYSTVNPIMGDIYSVLWEPEMLRSMGDTINILATEALTQGLQQVLGSTILISLMAALQLPVVLTKLAYLIDNPWTVSLDRANAAGLILADSLIERNLGTRPITFVGYSLGSRVIFSCLKELSKKGAYGLVQNVYLFGSPVVAKTDEYLKARSVVAGRFINGYATNDWILGYLFRLTSGGISRVAGLAPVKGISDIENIDVTEFVPGHMSYRTAMPRLLRHVGWIVESDDFAEIEDPDPDNHQERQRVLINEIEEARKELDKTEKEKVSKGKFGFFSRKKKNRIKKADWETYEEAKKEPRDSSCRVEDEFGNNHGALFDIEAIRAELASEQMEVRELKSTLPPMKLSLNPFHTSDLKSPQGIKQELSTKLTTFPKIYQSDEHYPKTSPNINKIHQNPTPLRIESHQSEELEMMFNKRCLISSNTKPILTPLRQSLEEKNKTELSHVPFSPMSNVDKCPAERSTLDIGYNVWADDDEFAEKEVQLTFA